MRINQNHLRRRRQEAGITLIEAVVSLAVFGVSFFSLYAGISLGFGVIGDARENLRATQILVEKLETIRLYSWDQINTPGYIPATFSESYYPAAADGAGGAQGGWSSGVVYNGRLLISNGPVGRTYSGDMRRITLGLSWISGGKTHTRTMSTFVTHHGLQQYIY